MIRTVLFSLIIVVIATVISRQQRLDRHAPRQQPKPRPAQRRVHHRPDAIVIKAKDATTNADILRTLKSDAALQRSVRSSVQNIRRSGAGALVLQLRKGVENAPSLGAEVDKVLGDVATASAIQHTSMVEIRDLDECDTRTEIAEELARSLGPPHLNEGVVKTLRKAYAERRRLSLRCRKTWPPGR
uniref:Uncharacterized protein n=1 Tax=Trichogramma kaykai TaxID=54128 RepID=A0ABD2W2P9_9HYME